MSFFSLQGDRPATEPSLNDNNAHKHGDLDVSDEMEGAASLDDEQKRMTQTAIMMVSETHDSPLANLPSLILSTARSGVERSRQNYTLRYFKSPKCLSQGTTERPSCRRSGFRSQQSVCGKQAEDKWLEQ